MEIVAEIVDDFSGGTLERPGFLQLRALIAEGKANAVVVFRQDRLSRDSADYMYLRKQWGRAGIEIHFCDRGKVSYDFSGIVLDSTMSGVNEGERWLIRDRTMNGRLKKAKNNIPVMMGQPPYGYQKMGKGNEARLVIDDRQIQIVKDIFTWYLYGDGVNGPLSLRAIGMKLDRQEPPPVYKNRTSKCWHASKISRILENEVYIGRLYYQKMRVEWGKRIPQPKDKWIKIDVPELAVIDRQTFNAAQKRAQKNREKAKRNRRRKYLLVGHIWCADCGRPVNGNACTGKHGKLTYYRCSSYTKKYVTCPRGNPSVRTYKIDEAVWSWIVWLLSDDENLRAGLQELVKRRKEEINPKQERLKSINESISNATNKIDRLISELSNFDDEVVLNAIRDKINRVTKQRDALTTEMANLESDLGQLEISEETEDQILELAAKVRDRLPGASYEEKRRILDILDVRIALYYGGHDDTHIEINCQIPTPSSEYLHNQIEGENIFIMSHTS